MFGKRFPGFTGEAPKAAPAEEELKKEMQRARDQEEEFVKKYGHATGKGPAPDDMPDKNAEYWRNLPRSADRPAPQRDTESPEEPADLKKAA